MLRFWSRWWLGSHPSRSSTLGDLPGLLECEQDTRNTQLDLDIYLSIYIYIYICNIHMILNIYWLVVWNIFIFPYIWNHHPNWLSYFFQRGRYTTNQYIYTYKERERERERDIHSVNVILIPIQTRGTKLGHGSYFSASAAYSPWLGTDRNHGRTCFHCQDQ